MFALTHFQVVFQDTEFPFTELKDCFADGSGRARVEIVNGTDRALVPGSGIKLSPLVLLELIIACGYSAPLIAVLRCVKARGSLAERRSNDCLEQRNEEQDR
jgi:hypothetical protein